MADTTSMGKRGRVAGPGQEASIDWEEIASEPDFRQLIQAKRNFIIPATLFFLVYYFSFLVFVGYFPKLAETNVVGKINVAYLVALSEFVMTWILVFLYVKRAGFFDRLANTIVERWQGGK